MERVHALRALELPGAEGNVQVVRRVVQLVRGRLMRIVLVARPRMGFVTGSFRACSDTARIEKFDENAHSDLAGQKPGYFE